MQNQIKNYTVNCADWEFVIDNQNPKSAAIEALILAFSRYKSNLKVSTTIMVTDIQKKNSQSFFGTHDILMSIGLNELATSLQAISCLPRNEIKSLT